MDGSSNPIMRIYYTSRPVLFGMCAGNELFYASLYLLHFTYGPFYIFYIIAVLCFPVAIGKLAIALVQVGKKENIFPQNNIHTLWLFQGYLACINMGMIDVEERKKAADGKEN